MELQPIAEESAAKAAAAQQVSSATEAAAASSASEARKVCIACGKPSENPDSDTAVLVAFATQRVLRRTDLLAVIHVSETQTVIASGGRKHATSYSTEGWPFWMPAPLKAWPEPQNLTAYELHASGSTAESVIDFVTTELKPDLLLIGSRPRGMVSRMFITGVSSSVVESAAVPTLVVRGDAPMQHHGEGVQRRIAICLDGSSSACRKVAEWAAAMLLTPADDVSLLHSPAGLEASQLLPAMANIEGCRTFLLSQGFPEHSVSPVELDFHTDARDAVIDFLEAGPKPFDICVCGSRGLKGSLTRFMLGSVTRYLLLYAPCSLLVLPPAALGEAAVVESGPA